MSKATDDFERRCAEWVAETQKAILQMMKKLGMNVSDNICSDCPPIQYPTDVTRCNGCLRGRP
jgi:hypothetical protein